MQLPSGVFGNGEVMTKEILWLAEYGVSTGLIEEADRIYVTNQLMDLFGMDDPGEESMLELPCDIAHLSEVLERMNDYAAEHGLIEDNTVTYRDLFDTKVMGLLTPRPSEVIRNFEEKHR